MHVLTHTHVCLHSWSDPHLWTHPALGIVILPTQNHIDPLEPDPLPVPGAACSTVCVRGHRRGLTLA